jgi:hypothetical protein
MRAFLDVTVGRERYERLPEYNHDRAISGVAGRASSALSEPGAGPFLQHPLCAKHGRVEPLLRVRTDGQAGQHDEPAVLVGKVDPVVPVGQPQDRVRRTGERGQGGLDVLSGQACEPFRNQLLPSGLKRLVGWGQQ